MTYRPHRDHDGYDYGGEDPDRPDRWRNQSRIRPVLVIVGGLLILERLSGTDIDLLQMGAGVFFLVWWARSRCWWQLLVGLFLVLGPLGALLGGLGLAATGHQSLLPVMVISAGALMMFRRNLQPGVVGALWMVIVVSIVLSITSSWDRNRPDTGAPPPRLSIPSVRVQHGGALPALDGRRLVIDAGANDVDIRTAAVPARLDRDVTVVATPNFVKLRLASDADIEVPVGTEIEVRADAGDIDADLKGKPNLTIRTGEGSVDLVFEGDPDVIARTEAGDVTLKGYDDADPEQRFVHEGPLGEVTVHTVSGDIDLERAGQTPR